MRPACAPGHASTTGDVLEQGQRFTLHGTIIEGEASDEVVLEIERVSGESKHWLGITPEPHLTPTIIVHDSVVHNTSEGQGLEQLQSRIAW